MSKTTCQCLRNINKIQRFMKRAFFAALTPGPLVVRKDATFPPLPTFIYNRISRPLPARQTSPCNRKGQCYTFVTFGSGPLTFKNPFDRMSPEVEECFCPRAPGRLPCVAKLEALCKGSDTRLRDQKSSEKPLNTGENPNIGP